MAHYAWWIIALSTILICGFDVIAAWRKKK
jgi:hypothetical protein